MSPAAYKNASTCYTTKFVHTATNKAKCPINCCVWEPNGYRLLTGAYSGELTLWNGFAFNFDAIVPAHDFPMRSMSWSKSEEILVSGDDSGVIKYWTPTMNNMKAFQGHLSAVREISFKEDVKFVTCSDDKTVKLWDTERVACEQTLQGIWKNYFFIVNLGHGWDVKSVQYHPYSALIASGSKDTTVRMWDPRSGKCLATINAHKNPVTRLRFHANGNMFITGSGDCSAKVWDLRTMNSVSTCRSHAEAVTALSFHPIQHDLFVTGSFDGHIFFWDCSVLDADVSPVAEIKHAHDSATWDFAWHPVGHMLVSASNDYTTRFWTRNFPGDEMKDKYNVNALPAAVRASAIVELAEISQSTQKTNPYASNKPMSLFDLSLAEQASNVAVKTGPASLPFSNLAANYKADNSIKDDRKRASRFDQPAEKLRKIN